MVPFLAVLLLAFAARTVHAWRQPGDISLPQALAALRDPTTPQPARDLATRTLRLAAVEIIAAMRAEDSDTGRADLEHVLEAAR